MGEVFAGRYELIDMIGEGGMGAVWRVRDRKKDLVVAAKVLRQSDAGSLLRFMREQGMRIHHPHVVTPLGWAGEDDRVLFTMPLVDGGAVNNLMRDHGPLPPRFAAELMRQLLGALDAVHSAGVVHRDIKPANLLLDATGTGRPHLWLTDFGVALATDGPRLTSLSVVMGTPGYLAPEQLRGADPDPVADLYAAGMVGIELVTGARPRPQMRTERVDLPTPPPWLPPPFWQLLVALADPDPRGRPATARDALAALDHPDLAWIEQTDVTLPRRTPDLPGAQEGDFLRPDDVDAQITGSASATGTQQFSGTATGTSSVGADTQRQPAQPDATRQQTRAAARLAEAPSAGGSASGRTRGGKRGGLAVLVAAPVVALVALGALWLGPWSGDDAEPGGPGVAQRDGVCAWSDAGSTAQDAAGQWLRCAASDGGFTWR